MNKVRIEVSAELLVSVRFEMEIDDTDSLAETNKRARNAAENVAQRVIGLRGETASACVQRITSFTTRQVSA